MRDEDWIRAGIFTAIGVAIVVVLGLLLDGPLADTALGRFDLEVSESVAEDRSDTVARLARVATLPTEWFVVIPASLLLAAVSRRWFRRWDEWLMASGSLMLENAVYLPANLLVSRSRPPVDVVGAVPFTDSFPSGHAAAAVAFYGGLCVVARHRWRTRPVRFLAPVAATLVVVAVSWSRVALGLHYVTDVVVGAGVGLAALLVVRRAVRFDADEGAEHPQQPAT